MFNFYFTEYKANLVYGDHFAIDVKKQKVS